MYLVRDVSLLPTPFSPYMEFEGQAGLCIKYTLTSTEPPTPSVTIRIYNMVGERVREVLRNERRSVGENADYWDGKTDGERMARNGRYIVQIIAEDSSSRKEVIKTVVLIK